MNKKTTKTILLHTLLLSYSLLPQCLCQQMLAANPVGVPNTLYQGNIPTFGTAAKGYGNTQINTGSYIDGQYWTGNPLYAQQPYGAYPSGYNNYNQYGGSYMPVGNYYPQQYYPQQYGQYGQSYYGQYPGFDAQYWTGNLQQQQFMAYPNPASGYYPGVPMYPVYQGHPAQYYHPGYPGFYPYRKKSFLSGPGNGLAKTLLGAVVVGTVAGAVARGK